MDDDDELEEWLNQPLTWETAPLLAELWDNESDAMYDEVGDEGCRC